MRGLGVKVSIEAATRAVLALHGQQIMGCASPLVVRCVSWVSKCPLKPQHGPCWLECPCVHRSSVCVCVYVCV